MTTDIIRHYFFGLVKRLDIRGHSEHGTYMTRWSTPLMRYCLHVFYRGDVDADPHDHPWDFWTFPFVEYYEEVYIDQRGSINVVEAGQWHFRDANYCHRVVESTLGLRLRTAKANTTKIPLMTRIAWWLFGKGTIVTIVYRGPRVREWGFWMGDIVLGRRIFVPWRQYLSAKRIK